MEHTLAFIPPLASDWDKEVYAGIHDDYVAAIHSVRRKCKATPENRAAILSRFSERLNSRYTLCQTERQSFMDTAISRHLNANRIQELTYHLDCMKSVATLFGISLEQQKPEQQPPIPSFMQDKPAVPFQKAASLSALTGLSVINIALTIATPAEPDRRLAHPILEENMTNRRPIAMFFLTADQQKQLETCRKLVPPELQSTCDSLIAGPAYNLP